VSHATVSKPGQGSPSFHGNIILINLSSHQEGMRIPHGDKPTLYSALLLVLVENGKKEHGMLQFR